ncbi:MAG: DNA gyrase C-terminal beta-propeller domain-containing protein, partial [Candidatus Promineifilaceae bacterium]|nr:DNA gyrase C-terminal beta-propeller domain-containing protein [Candidatus Promineifilaceae bacterium]
GPDKVHSVDTFGSVTAGLGIIAHGIERGEIEGQAYTRDDLKRQDVTVNRPNVSILDSRLLRRRIQVQEEAGGEDAGEGERVLVMLTKENELLTYRFSGKWPDLEGMEGEVPPLHAVVVGGVDEPLLLITSRYRFLVVTPRELMDLEALGQPLAELHHFGPYEEVYAVSGWGPLKEAERMVLVTSLGYARTYPTDVIVPAIEAPVPLTFEQPLPGWPLAALGAQGDEELIVVTDSGRGARFAVAEIPGTGTQAFRRKEEEEMAGAVLAVENDELLLVTDEGYGRRLPPAAVYAPEKGNSRGRVVISRRPVKGVTRRRPGAALWAVTTVGLKPLAAEAIPLERDTTRSHRLITLAAEEAVRHALSV